MKGTNEVSQPSVLLAFRAENVRSFKDELELSLLATAMAEKQHVREVPRNEEGALVRVNPVAGVFGANASGKSNLLKVMMDMRRHVLDSFRLGVPDGNIAREPFRLDKRASERPSRYEIALLLNGVRHEYGMELDDKLVAREWAYHYPKGRPRLLFDREGDAIRLGSVERSRSRAVLDLLRPNALLVSTAAAAGHPLLMPLYRWFHRNLRSAEAESRAARQLLTAQMLDDDIHREAVLRMLHAADLGITDVRIHALDPAFKERVRRALPILMGTEEQPPEDAHPLLEGLDELANVNLIHRGSGTEFELEAHMESLGTLIWFGLVGPVLDSLRRGAVLLVDEIDASLHPNLVEQLVQMFQNPESNPRHAQLVFNSHDTTLLGDAVNERLLGRDQIWFTQKLNDGRTELYPLSRFNPRKQEAIGKRYLDGWYGAKPIVTTEDFGSIGELVASEQS